jgi:hypothetical protein
MAAVANAMASATIATAAPARRLWENFTVRMGRVSSTVSIAGLARLELPSR